MFTNSDQRERSRFLEQSIENARDEFANNSRLRRGLGRSATTFVETSERLFIPNVRLDRISIPRRHREEGIPVVARRPQEAGLTLSADFMRFYPRQWKNIEGKMEAWGYQHPIKPFLHSLERSMIISSISKPRTSRNNLSSNGALASVNTEQAVFSFRLEDFSNAGTNPKKLVSLRPVLSVLYEGPNTPKVPLPIWTHEFVHVHQSERDMLTTDFSDEEHVEELFRRELEAYHYGAHAVVAQLDPNVPFDQLRLDDTEYTQLIVEQERQRAREKDQHHDLFEPTEALRNQLNEIGIDL